MNNLKNSKVFRGGASTKYLSLATRNIWVSSESDIYGEKAQFSFAISSKGGGHTKLHLDISPEDFKSIISTFAACNRKVTLQAICEIAATLFSAELSTKKTSD